MPLYLSFAFILLVIGLRGRDVAFDTSNYWESIRYGNQNPRAEFEFLYGALEDLIRKFSPALFYIFWTAFAALIPLFIAIKKRSLDPILTCILFLIVNTGFGFYMVGVRQSIAISLCVIAILSFDATDKKNWIKSLVIILVATFFHSSSAICFALLGLSFIRLNRKIEYTLLTATALYGFFMGVNVFSYLPQLEALGVMQGQLDIYSSEHTILEMDLNIKGVFMLVTPLSIFTYYILKYSDNSIQNRYFFWGVILNNIFVRTPFLPRIFAYATILMIFLIPNCYSKIPQKERMVVILLIALMFIFFLLYGVKDFGIEKYHTIFSEF
ncbi:MAG: EpsG family protein [Bacteroidales bacterium]|nr:EpsG family protein [Bacteroidales bacterium]